MSQCTCSKIVLAFSFILFTCRAQIFEDVADFSTSSDFQVLVEEVVEVQPAAATPTERHGRSAEIPGERSVQFTAFNETFVVMLQPSSALVSPHFAVVVRQGNNEAGFADFTGDASRCMYRGRASKFADTNSTLPHRSATSDNAAFDICRGMRGIITLTDSEFLSVQPWKPLRSKRSSPDAYVDNALHLIQRIRWKPESQEARWTRRQRRKKRYSSSIASAAGTAANIETAIFVDAFLYNHMATTRFPHHPQQEITHFVLAMINAVQLLYQDESLAQDVQFQVQRLEMWTTQPLELQPASTSASSRWNSKQGINDIDLYLDRFCRWQSRHNPSLDSDPLHWDHALLLTGLDLFAIGRDGFTSNQIVGLAPIGGMCTATSSCTVNEGRHFESVYVVAHEIGHNLGMKHDGPDAGNDCHSGSFIMSPSLGSGKTTWSPCSKNYLDAFLRTRQAQCLWDRSPVPDQLDHNASNSLPGQRFSADQQCVLIYGKGSHQKTQRSLDEICRHLHCTNTSPSHQTDPLVSHPALEGTHCGLDKWCRRGHCSSRVRFGHYENTTNAIDDRAHHQPWLTVSTCASGCLYGNDRTLAGGSTALTTQVLTCGHRIQSNSIGCNQVQVRYQTCNETHMCSRVNRTTVIQYSDDICAKAARFNDSILPRGTQQLSSDAGRSCQVWCYLKSGGLMTGGWTFPDGTRCQTSRNLFQHPSASSTFCLSGQCQEFSCQSDATFQLNPEVCQRNRLDNPELNTIPDDSYNRPFKWRREPWQPSMSQRLQQFQEVPSYHSDNEMHPSNIVEAATFNSPSLLLANREPDRYAPRSGQWGPWKSISSCRSGCLLSSKGLRLVERTCYSGQCQGSSSSVQLCTPSFQECPVGGQSGANFADRVCLERWPTATSNYLHLGIQIESSPGRPDDGCVVHCRNPLTGNLLAVQGESGWFPSGTSCNHRSSSYCLSGRCLDFDEEGIPMKT